MEILITDVTEMSGNNYCVAGWDAANKRMVRPLPKCLFEEFLNHMNHL